MKTKKESFKSQKQYVMAKQEISNVNVEVNAFEVVISGVVRNYRRSSREYHWGTNPWDDTSTITFQVGDVWLEYYSWGNYTSHGKTLKEVDAGEKVEAPTTSSDDDGRYTYTTEEKEEKKISLSVPLKCVSVENGVIGSILREEMEWRKAQFICDDSVVAQIIEAVGGRYEVVEDVQKGIHNSIVKDAKGQLYSVDVCKRPGMGYWIYDATVRPFDPEAEAAQRKAFGRKVSALSRFSGVPFEVIKILWREQLDSPEVERILHLLRLIHDLPKSEEELHELSCGIDRRTAEMARLLPEDVYDFFHVGDLGQSRNWTLAGYIAG